MIRHVLTVTTVFALMTGIAVAQISSSTSTTTQSTTSIPLPLSGSSTETNTRTTTDGNGVVTDQTQTFTRGTVVVPSIGPTTTSRTIETTTSR